MFGGGPASAEEQKAAKQMANAQVISSFIQFGFAVGLMNLGETKNAKQNEIR